jgi:hypothetical protein
MRFSWSITSALGNVLKTLHTLWTRVLWPIIRQLPRALGRLRRIIERDLPRLLRIINRLRARLLEIYERYMRPVLNIIQRVRRMLLILRLFRVKWAQQLDERLSWLQGKLMQPLAVALEHIAMIEGWLNLIVTSEQLIQETIFNNSLFHYQDPLVRSWWAAHGRPLDPLVMANLYPRQAAVTADESRRHVLAYLTHGTGPIAEDVSHGLAELRKLT